jgi:hypothetical protein
MRGTGNLLHDDPLNRPAAAFGGKNRLHFAAEKKPYLAAAHHPARVVPGGLALWSTATIFI